MSTNGEYFNFPTTEAEAAKCWSQAMPLSDDMVAEWMDDPSEYRFACVSTWAYLSQDEQDGYFAELKALEGSDYIVTDGDDGDGCVTRFYIRKPN